jgi:hypothetical protein
VIELQSRVVLNCGALACAAEAITLRSDPASVSKASAMRMTSMTPTLRSPRPTLALLAGADPGRWARGFLAGSEIGAPEPGRDGRTRCARRRAVAGIVPAVDDKHRLSVQRLYVQEPSKLG